MRIFTPLFLLFIVLSSKSFSQADTTAKRARKLSFYFAFDVRWSLVRDIPVRIGGLKTGISFKRRHAVGLGYYNLGRPFFGEYFLTDQVEYDAQQSLFSRRANTNVDVNTKVRLSMDYFSLFYEYRFLAHRKWNMDWNIQFGAGNVKIEVFNIQNGRMIGGYPKMEMINLVESSVSVQYKIVQWLGLGAGLGYRYMLHPNEYISTTFNYPIWSLKFILFPGQLIPVFQGKKKWYK